jgi:predicted anti-sigma-YlaC factor YlaD
MECLDEETVLALLDGELEIERVRDVDRHIDGCTSCRRLLSTLAEETPSAQELDDTA